MYYDSIPLVELNAIAQPVIQRNLAESCEIAGELDLEWYANADDAGLLRAYAGWKEDKVVGYCVMLVAHAPHMAGVKIAIQDSLYVLPEYRTTGAGIRLMQFADNDLKAQGVQVVYRQSRKLAPCASMLIRYGYTEVESTYMKRLHQ